MEISITKLYAILTEKLDRETAESLTSYIEKKINEEVKNEARNLATKEDLYQVKTDMIKWYVGLFIALALMIIGLYLK